MLTNPKRLILIAGALVLLAAQLFALYSLSYSTDDGHPIPSIKQQIARIQHEPLEQGLRQLWDRTMCKPAVPSSAIVFSFPFEKEVGKLDIEEILSNRRFLKVFDELAGVPANKANALVAAHLDEAWSNWKELFEVQFKRLAHLLYSTTDIGFPSTSDGKKADVVGCRQRLLSLLLIVGNLKLNACKSSVEGITREAWQQYVKYSRDPKINRSNAYVMLQGATNYNRQILATALIGVQPEETRSKFQATKERWHVRELPKFNARATPYDWLIGPTDWSLGKLVIQHLQPIDDDTFEGVLNELKVSVP